MGVKPWSGLLALTRSDHVDSGFAHVFGMNSRVQAARRSNAFTSPPT